MTSLRGGKDNICGRVLFSGGINEKGGILTLIVVGVDVGELE